MYIAISLAFVLALGFVGYIVIVRVKRKQIINQFETKGNDVQFLGWASIISGVNTDHAGMKALFRFYKVKPLDSIERKKNVDGSYCISIAGKRYCLRFKDDKQRKMSLLIMDGEKVIKRFSMSDMSDPTLFNMLSVYLKEKTVAA